MIRRPMGGLLAVIFSFSAKAEITLDGSLGPAGGAIPLDANNQLEIREEMGQTVGNNLFHSFGTFNIAAGETAAFTGTSPIENVLSRVTGGTASSIDGTLRTNFANSAPNLFLLNPAGVVFGPNASLDVQGSFHVSTADYLRLEDGARFNSIPSAADQVLTTAPPEAFGFLGDNPGNISIKQASLAVPDGKTLSVVGGDIQIQGGELVAPAGRIDMASVGSPGEVIRTDTDLRLEGFDALGRIELDQVATVDTSGEGGGAIFIRGGELLVKNSVVKSRSLGNAIGQAIDIDLPNGFLEVRDGGVIDTATRGAGRGGDLFVNAQNISMNGDGSEFNTGLVANSSSTGDGGRIVVRTESLEVLNRAEISVNAFDAGNGGELLVEANSIVLSHDGRDSPAGLYALATSGGDAGRITVRSNSLDVRNGATINTSTAGDGNGGEVFIEADNLLFTSRGSIGAIATGGGDGGAVFVKADRAEILDGAFISTATGGIGKGSSFSIEARDIVLAGGAHLGSGALSTGEAGAINIKAHSLEIRDGAVIFNRSEGEGNGGTTLIDSSEILVTGNSRILAGALSQGNAGSLTIKADSLKVSRGGVIDLSAIGAGKGGDLLIEAAAILIVGDEEIFLTGIGSGSINSGDAGSVTISADNLEVRNGAIVITTTLGAGKGGDVSIEVGSMSVSEDGRIAASAVDSGAAGNVTIRGDNVEVRDGSLINTSTSGTGKGGDISISAGNVLLSGDGAVGLTGLGSASIDGAGNAGSVTIEATNLNVRGGATINLLTGAAGDGGNLTVNATNVMLSGEEANGITGFLTINASRGAIGNAGGINVDTEHFEMSGARQSMPAHLV